MKKFTILLLIAVAAILTIGVKWAISDDTKIERERRSQVNTRVDNNGYWRKMAEQGLAVLNPEVEIAPAVYTGSKINAKSVAWEDSPDVPVTTTSSRQSENSIFIDPNNKLTALNSNNSGPISSSFYGANDLFTFDGSETWQGEVFGAGGSNSGDPAACIDTDGRWFVGFIASNGGQGVSYSDDQGESWTKKTVTSFSSTDKNHLWVDVKEGSPYENYVYNSWVEFSGADNNDIVVQRSIDGGETWMPKINISNEVNAGSHNQGVNLSTGPNGEVYAVWAIYDGWPQDEKALGFAKSLDGGETWEPSTRIITNIRGIRNSGVPQNMRVNSFPVMAVDIGNGPNSGNIYVVWTNVGIPGQNTGSDRDVYMIKSTNDGITWSAPIRVNQDPIGQGKSHYLPWITCDPSNGILSVVFYDNRNTNANQAEAWVAVSTNAGETWEDFKVSDVSFTPSPIPGFASGYMGDYLSISALDGLVYPCWTDNRTGQVMTYVSVFETLDIRAPYSLNVAVDQETGSADLSWEFNATNGFEHFIIYRDDVQIGISSTENFTDQLPDYGYYNYKVTAYYGGTNESIPASKNAQWGSSSIEVLPSEVTATLFVNEIETQQLVIKNNGILDLEFSLSGFFNKSLVQKYDIAKGGGDEYISNVTFENIQNTSGSEGYADYTDYFAELKSDQSYEITITNGNPYEGDQCAVWIDWDQNMIFDEEPVLLNRMDNKFAGIITPQNNAKQGVTGMRIRLAGPGQLNAYDDTKYGETEDYRIYLVDWLTMSPEDGIVAVGDSMLVDLTFDATDKEPGLYDEVIWLNTNDLENIAYSIPVTMIVTDLMTTVSADPSALCQGESTQLDVELSGGSGTFTFAWSSIPEGFESEEQNPVVSPLENTKYIVQIDDGMVIMSDSVDITVFSKPEVDLGTDQVLCDESEFELDAGNPGATYLWSTGDTTQTITASGEGMNTYWVEVINENSCLSSDTVMIDFATSPIVELGADTIICHNSAMTLDAGNPGASYLWSTGETTQTINIAGEDFEYGTYDFSVQVTNDKGCENTDDITVEIKDCTSIDENQQLVSLNVFPNPNTGMFNLNLSSFGSQTVSVQIINLSGKVVYEVTDLKINNAYQMEINLDNAANGVYNIFVISENGITDKKVVIQK